MHLWLYSFRQQQRPHQHGGYIYPHQSHISRRPSSYHRWHHEFLIFTGLSRRTKAARDDPPAALPYDQNLDVFSQLLLRDMFFHSILPSIHICKFRTTDFFRCSEACAYNHIPSTTHGCISLRFHLYFASWASCFQTPCLFALHRLHTPTLLRAERLCRLYTCIICQ